jgi:GNAT superfamily N-acetyltransferase
MTATDTRQLPAVRQAGGRDLEPLISLLTGAFVGSAVGRQMIADEHVRGQVLRRYFRIIVPHAITHGKVDVIGTGHAAAFWYRYDGSAEPAIPGYQSRLAEIAGSHYPRVAAFDAARSKHRPTDRPYHRLAFLAVTPQLRGQRLATTLLEHHHRGLDTAVTPAYVEAIGRDALLFARHGYEPAEPHAPAPGAPPLHPMWRSPRC